MARWKAGRPGRPPNSVRKLKNGGADETKHARFQRMAEGRINRALTAITMIGNLATPHNDWNDGDIKKMRDTINARLDAAFKRFNATEPQERRPFTFGETHSA